MNAPKFSNHSSEDQRRDDAQICSVESAGLPLQTSKEKSKSHVLNKFQKSFRNSTTCILVSIFAALLLSVLITAVRGVPVPIVHDEYSYLLGADTFASGRLTNPTHPHWEHFESFHIIQKPSYASKYHPAQALILALGQKLGHPIIGVWITTALCCGSLVWMLNGWLPRRHFWLITIFVVLHPGIQIVWGQSYWGGTLAMTGASLLLGALGRLDQRMSISLSFVAGTGVLLLANSRPFEGVVLTAAVGTGLLWKLFRYQSWSIPRFTGKVILPAACVLAVGFFLMAKYNQAVTGDWKKMAYSCHESAYGWNPLFIGISPGEKPDYRHPVIEKFHNTDRIAIADKYSSIPKIVSVKSQTAYSMAKFFCGGTILFALFGFPFVWKRQRLRFAFLILIPTMLAALATPWAGSRYAAAASPLLILIFAAALIAIWKQGRKFPILRTGLIFVIPIFHLIWLVSIYDVYADLAKRGWAVDRASIERQLLDSQGQHLVLVHYSDAHNPHAEWVYNKADIDKADVVWAREMGPKKQAALIQYFSEREIWVVEADKKPPLLHRLQDAPSTALGTALGTADTQHLTQLEQLDTAEP